MRSKKKMSENAGRKSGAASAKKILTGELDKWERGEWQPEDHRASMDEVMRKIKVNTSSKKMTCYNKI